MRARFSDAYIGPEDSDWGTFLTFGRACLKTGDRKSAASWFHRAMVLKPNEEGVALVVGQALADHGILRN